MQALEVLYTFHPVGQGMFTSGAILPEDEKSRPFWWVYDCGTHLESHFERLDEEIEILAQRVGRLSKFQKPTIDLVFISHFDKDHVNGLLKLLEHFKIGRLVFPFVSLYERLLIAFPTKAKTLHNWQRFIANPTRFIEASPTFSVTRISIVPYSGSTSPPGTFVEDGDAAPWGDDDPIVISPRPSEPPDHIVAEDNMFNGRIRIEWLSPSSTLKIGNVWEFVPYNKHATVSRIPVGFIPAIKTQTEALLNTKDPAEREQIKNFITSEYGFAFGATPRNKNIISLFFYSGPLQRAGIVLEKPHTGRTEIEPFVFKGYYLNYSFDSYQDCTSGFPTAMILTGDGSLNNPTQLRELIQYFGNSRMGLAKVLQVMHHGARTSWHAGVAAELDPNHSIFCAYKPAFRRHPHDDVWDDFASNGRWICGANAHEGFSLHQIIIFKV